MELLNNSALSTNEELDKRIIGNMTSGLLITSLTDDGWISRQLFY